ncbi:MAG TPA: GNAT family N-acetyltransferase [Dongiaceae bacterium]|jgi:ribosomal protein S18 acetylase RimI-like enzyme
MGAAVSFRLATAADRLVLQDLFHECEVHYEGHAAPSRAAVVAHVDANIIPGLIRCEILLAEAGGAVAGYASFGQLYPAPNLGGQIHVKDIFIRRNFRGRGIGAAIIRRLAALAVERNCTRVDWTAESDNPRAVAFYDRLGVPRVASKIYFRLDGETLAAFAAAGKGESPGG